MLSDEEKKAFQYYKECNEKDLENYEYLHEVSQKQVKYLEILLNLIEKQSKEIEELKNADLTTVYMNGFYDGENKVKDKIKAKIDEVKEEKEHYLEINDEYNAQICDCIIEEYESLLEKE